MLSIDINHPDVLDFIKIKRDLTQVTGANISVKLNNDFMEAVEADDIYILRFPCNSQVDSAPFRDPDFKDFNVLLPFEKGETEEKLGYLKVIKAKEYWEEIIKSAHNVAEPGIMFEDNHINYSPDGVYPQFKGITSNPCGEIFMQPYDACRLVAVNLLSFVDKPFTEEARFNHKKFYEYNYEAMRLSDDIIDLEIERIDKILYKIEQDTESDNVKRREYELWQKVRNTAMASRRTGLGFTALGDTYAALNLKYDSESALLFTEALMHSKLKSELDCTIDLAILRGTFTGWDRELEFPSHNSTKHFGNDFYRMLWKEFPEQAHKMEEYGRRNVSFNTVAPTGTVNKLAA